MKMYDPEIDFLRVMEVLNAPCGDVLKAQVINQTTSLDIDFTRMILPKGQAEAAFERASITPKPKKDRFSEGIPDENPVTQTTSPVVGTSVTVRVPGQSMEQVMDNLRTLNQRSESKITDIFKGTKFQDMEPTLPGSSSVKPPSQPAEETEAPPIPSIGVVGDKPKEKVDLPEWITPKQAVHLRQISYGSVTYRSQREGWRERKEGRNVFYHRDDVIAGADIEYKPKTGGKSRG